jgi:hypothetical protein
MLFDWTWLGILLLAIFALAGATAGFLLSALGKTFFRLESPHLGYDSLAGMFGLPFGFCLSSLFFVTAAHDSAGSLLWIAANPIVAAILSCAGFVCLSWILRGAARRYGQSLSVNKGSDQR